MTYLDWNDLKTDPVLNRLLDRFAAAEACWLGSVRPDGRPHLAPIWHVLHDQCVYVVTQSRSIRAHNLRTNPAVSVALADTSNALIIEGLARPDPAAREALRPLFQTKYEWDIGADADYDAIIAIVPRKVMAWGELGDGRWSIGSHPNGER